MEISDQYETLIKPEQRWVGKQYGASFELTRTEGLILNCRGFMPDVETESFDLILKGKAKGKQRLFEEFMAVLGDPLEISPATRFPRSLCAIWDAEYVLKNLPSEQAST